MRKVYNKLLEFLLEFVSGKNKSLQKLKILRDICEKTEELIEK